MGDPQWSCSVLWTLLYKTHYGTEWHTQKICPIYFIYTNFPYCVLGHQFAVEWGINMTNQYNCVIVITPVLNINSARYWILSHTNVSFALVPHRTDPHGYNTSHLKAITSLLGIMTFTSVSFIPNCLATGYHESQSVQTGHIMDGFNKSKWYLLRRNTIFNVTRDLCWP